MRLLRKNVRIPSRFDNRDKQGAYKLFMLVEVQKKHEDAQKKSPLGYKKEERIKIFNGQECFSETTNCMINPSSSVYQIVFGNNQEQPLHLLAKH